MKRKRTSKKIKSIGIKYIRIKPTRIEYIKI